MKNSKLIEQLLDLPLDVEIAFYLDNDARNACTIVPTIIVHGEVIAYTIVPEGVEEVNVYGTD